MSHSERCLDANRLGDGFDCVCEPPACPRCAQALEALSEGTAEALRLHARTAAEQAVLDAMADAVLAQFGGQVGIGIESQDVVGRAELARRGLK